MIPNDFRSNLLNEKLKRHNPIPIAQALAGEGSFTIKVDFSKSLLDRGRREAPRVCQGMSDTQLLPSELVEQEIKATHPPPLSPSQKLSLQRGVLPQRLILVSPLSRGDGAKRQGCVKSRSCSVS